MKKIILLSLLAGLFLSSCNYESPKYKAMVASRDSLQNVLEQKDKEANDYLSIINEIEQNLEQIKMTEGYITADQGEATQDARTRIQNNINLINQLLSDNKAKIEELEQKAKQIGALQGRVNALKKQMQEKETEIAELKKQLEEKNIKIHQLDSTVVKLNTNISTLSTEKQMVENVVVEQDGALHTAYYFIGTSKDLKTKGIDIKKQGVNKGAFTKIDTRQLTTIDLKSKGAIVLTNHPMSSYKINIVNKNATLQITNPTEFWSMSKYLVVKIK